jgi:[ribosomal protein S5]-alanine N-acetyltransferase
MQLQTEIPHCVLRPWSPEDKPSLVHHANNHKVWRNMTEMFPHPYREADAEAWFSVVSTTGRSVHLAVVVREQAVGGIGVIAGEGIRRCTGQFGYWLGESVWGQGFATAAARTMATYALETLQFARLEASVFEWNPASARVLEKSGFVREAVLRKSVFKDNRLIDSVLFARLRDDG